MSNFGQRIKGAFATRARGLFSRFAKPSPIGEVQELRHALLVQNRRLSTILENIGQGLCVFDGAKRLVLANAQYAELYGVAPDAIQPGMELPEILDLRVAAGSLAQTTRTNYLAWRENVATTNLPTDSIVELPTGRIIRIHHEPLPDQGWVATHEDVTQQRRAEDELRRRNMQFDAAIANMSQGLCMLDSEERLIVCNQNYLTMFGMSDTVVKPGVSLLAILRHSVDIGVATDADELYRIRREVIAARQPATYCEVLADGRIIDIWHRPMADGGWVSTYGDITERRRAESRVAHMATHDSLTGLPNRALLHERLSQSLRGNSVNDRVTSLLLIDLDRFKDVNDRLGHAAGDKLLRFVAERLQSVLGDKHFAARLGGDEFAVLVHDTSQSETANLAQKIFEALVAPYELDGCPANVGASIGISLAPFDGGNPDALLKSADLALYRAKSRERGGAVFFDSEMTALADRRRALEIELREAIRLGQFVAHYQPQFNVRTGHLTGAEALIRWRHPTRGLVGPGEFISFAEEIGLIGPIGEWIMRQACRDAAQWKDEMRVAVNLSAVQLRNDRLVDMVVSALVAAGVSPSRLELEVTESILLEDTETTLKTLRRLRELGIRVCLDDFGTGYSSLSYLRSFTFDKIKIDRSFVHEVALNTHGAGIVQALASLGAILGMETTAEGVETEEQLDLVRKKGCTEVQGFYFSPPRPAAELAELFGSSFSNARRDRSDDEPRLPQFAQT